MIWWGNCSVSALVGKVVHMNVWYLVVSVSIFLVEGSSVDLCCFDMMGIMVGFYGLDRYWEYSLLFWMGCCWC